MNAGVDEVAYAAALRRSARETARRWRLAGGPVRGNRGGLTEGVLDVLGQWPVTAVMIAERLGRPVTDIPVVLRRLEERGLAARAGRLPRNEQNQPVTLWWGAADHDDLPSARVDFRCRSSTWLKPSACRWR